jgi:serine/threonine protein phosphatase PrpC
MEDAHLCKEIKIANSTEKGMIFGVFDGHGGKEVAEYAK